MIFQTLLTDSKIKTATGLAICALLVLLTAACGAKGPLYLPDEEETKQQETETDEKKKKIEATD